MEVVLLENIKNLGKIGDIVDVKRGHGRNFLIKYGKALKASKDNIDFVEIRYNAGAYGKHRSKGALPDMCCVGLYCLYYLLFFQ